MNYRDERQSESEGAEAVNKGADLIMLFMFWMLMNVRCCDELFQEYFCVLFFQPFSSYGMVLYTNHLLGTRLATSLSEVKSLNLALSRPFISFSFLMVVVVDYFS